MDEDMEDSMELTFTAVEIDLDYEFDAARYFDFTREESSDETRQAELWFESAGSYPPSPFVTQLVLREHFLQQTVNTYPKSKDLANTTLPDSVADNEEGQDFSIVEMNHRDCEAMKGEIFAKLQSGCLQKFQNQHLQLPTGLTFYNHMSKANSKAEIKSAVKPSLPRTSTLLKPTASQLAKQSRQPCKVGDLRVQKLMVESNEGSSNNPFGIECQAAKRQKLEGGLLRKVADGKEQSNLVHKPSKKDGATEGNAAYTKLKLTIPREPDLQTAHRVQRLRPNNIPEPEIVPSTVRRFKALPLNRKILEAPSLLLPKRSIPRLPEFQEFHLKTSERALQHTHAVSSSAVSSSNTVKVLNKPSTDATAESANGESRRLYFADAPKPEGRDFVHNFKARPLNKKIFSSKGDIGVFRNTKKETTVPMEFNLYTERRAQHNLPVELFNKLTLNELHPNAGCHLKLPRPTSIPPEGSKENRSVSFKQEQEIKHHLVKQKPPRFWEKAKSTPCTGMMGGNPKLVPHMA